MVTACSPRDVRLAGGTVASEGRPCDSKLRRLMKKRDLIDKEDLCQADPPMSRDQLDVYSVMKHVREEPLRQKGNPPLTSDILVLHSEANHQHSNYMRGRVLLSVYILRLLCRERLVAPIWSGM